MKDQLPPLPETPAEALGLIVREKVLIDDRVFWIERPHESDRLLDNDTVRACFAADEFLPYWTDLWPVSRILAKVILREPWPPGLEALEVGCGLGLPGIAALAAGLRVTFSDYDSTALRFAAANARLNGFQDFRTLRFDWRNPPPDLVAPVVLASDLMYEMRNVEPLVLLFKKVLTPDGLCLLTDQDRIPASAMRDMLLDHGFTYEARPMRAGEPGKGRVKGTLYRIRHRT